jgi:hypothetical protein
MRCFVCDPEGLRDHFLRAELRFGIDKALDI